MDKGDTISSSMSSTSSVMMKWAGLGRVLPIQLGSHQGMDARVIDNLEATEDLNLLPAVQALPQRCCHLAQSLPEERRKKMGGMGWA